MSRLLFLLLLTAPLAHAGEVEIVAAWCRGETEYPLDEPFGPPTRVDCLTQTHAWEVDWAPKWAEGLGQARYYAARTGRRAGVLLLLTRSEDVRYLVRLYQAIGDLPVDVQVMEVQK